MQWTTSASHLKTGLFATIKFLPRLFSKTFHHRACPSTYHHPRSTCHAGTLFQGTPPIPSLHISYSPCDDARVQRHISLSFQGPKSGCQHQSLAATHLYADTSQI